MSDQLGKKRASSAKEWSQEPVSIPDQWAYVNFDDVFDNLSLTGLKIPQKEYETSGVYPVVDQGADLIGGYTNDEGKVINLRRPVVVFGDHTKCFKYLPFPFAPGADGVKVLIPKGEVDGKYLFYACKALQLPDRGYSRHFSFLKKCKFPLPPKDEQRDIVAKIETLFSELDKGIESLKAAREQLKAYRQAVLKHAFEGKLTEQWRQQNPDKLESPEQLLARIQQEREQRYQQQLEGWKRAIKIWESNDKEGKKPGKPSAYKTQPAIENEELEKLPSLPECWGYVRLAEIAAIGSGMSVSKDRKLADPVEVPYLRVANVQRGMLVLHEIKTMPVERLSLSALKLQRWDILFNEGGDRDKLGRGWVWENQIEPCITQNHVFRATPYMTDEFHSKFISHWGNTFGQLYFEKSGKQTTNLASINKAALSGFPVPLPSMEEQRKIIEVLDDLTSLIDSFENDIEIELAKSETLRQSILKRAFSGHIIRKGPGVEVSA
ncbi:restriction endonuclease subunit S [Alloalcanivorax xenomutans]|uniref:restriction endonuclease subunit S n=1 Tax=Alloalcanivorax xenomutans TaxID=1094342 RepID=UPI003D9AD90E